MLNDLNTCFLGGYSRIETLKYVDCLTKELEMLEVAKENKQNGIEYTIPNHTAKTVISSSLFGGFNKKDVDEFVSEISIRIDELRKELV